MSQANSVSATVNDIVSQARQGSVAAIIQVLNEKLAESGIRTRAVLSDGVLQLLCEAPTVEQLPQTELVERVRSILEAIGPRGIRKVSINSRLVREQQLLWLEDITRDPENQLLWSELIKLKQPNPVVRLWQDLRRPRALVDWSQVMPKQHSGKQQYFWRGLVGGASLCIFLLIVGWALRDRLGIDLPTPLAPVANSDTPPPNDETPSPSPQQDPFAQAVQLAEQSAIDGQSAATAAEWLELAARWQRAADLMAEVPPDDPRYSTAQDRVEAYRRNRRYALQKSEQIQAETESESAAEPPETEAETTP